MALATPEWCWAARRAWNASRETPDRANSAYHPPSESLPPDQAGQTRQLEPAREIELVQQVALPEGGARQPVSGYLYFPYEGKPSKIKSVVLVYDSPAGQARIKLK